MQEIWKDIKGYEGLYQISNLGNVKSLHFNHSSISREIKYFNNNGYKRVVLYKNKNRKKFLVHRLIAQAFIPNPENKPYINHKDGNKQNNSIENLEWCTPKENVNHAIVNNLRPLVCKPTGLKRGESPVAKTVIQKDKNGSIIAIWRCAQDAADSLNFHMPSIRRCCRGERKTYQGYIWEYK